MIPTKPKERVLQKAQFLGVAGLRSDLLSAVLPFFLLDNF